MTETASCVLIVPAALRDAANQFGLGQDWGPDNFCVPLGSQPFGEATHYGCRPDVGPGFIAQLANPPAEAATFFAAMIHDIAEHGEWGAAHFDAVIAVHGLVRL